jgi:hypothetical protein
MVITNSDNFTFSISYILNYYIKGLVSRCAVFLKTLQSASRILYFLNVFALKQPESSRYSDWLRAGRLRGRSRVPVGSRISLLHVVHTSSGVHSTSYPMGIGGFLPVVKQLGHEADHSLPTSAEVKKMWIHTSTSPCAFIAQRLII